MDGISNFNNNFCPSNNSYSNNNSSTICTNSVNQLSASSSSSNLNQNYPSNVNIGTPATSVSIVSDITQPQTNIFLIQAK